MLVIPRVENLPLIERTYIIIFRTVHEHLEGLRWLINIQLDVGNISNCKLKGKRWELTRPKPYYYTMSIFRTGNVKIWTWKREVMFLWGARELAENRTRETSVWTGNADLISDRIMKCKRINKISIRLWSVSDLHLKFKKYASIWLLSSN